MKTKNILVTHEYESNGGPIECVPKSDVIRFLKRVEDRLTDISQGMPLSQFVEEIRDAIETLENRLTD